MTRPQQLRIAFLFISCVLIWGSSFILIKRAVGVYTPYQVGAMRLSFAGLAMLPFALRFLLRKGARAYPWHLLLLSTATGSILPGMLFPLAQTHLASATTGAINALTPLFTLLIGAAFFAQPVSRLKGLGILVGLLGSALLILDRPADELTRNLTYGLFALTAAFLYGVNLNLIKRYLSHLRPLEINSLALSLNILPASMYLLLGSDFSTRLATLPAAPAAVGYVAILGVMATAVALLLFYELIQLGGPILAASTTYFIPFVALGWGLADGEALGPLHLLGLATVLGGVYLVAKK